MGIKGCDDWHVTPVDDTYKHEDSSDCWCRPIETIEGSDSIWTHRSHDRREDYEEGRRKSN